MIRILDDQVVNQIAAGEVVERPASVVKELVENALDAGATAIEIVLKAGGRNLIRVEDNGSGMNRQDALLCVERHATSKIRATEDLFSVATFGFRGEALPSIASVSKFILTTRPADEELGTRLVIEGGKLVSVDPAGCPAGTRIEVRSLFSHLPARRKFLRAEATEAAHCLEAVYRQALLREDVAFRVTHDDRESFRSPATSREQRVRAILGDAGKALLPVRFQTEGVEVEGWTAPPGVHVAESTGSVYLYVNGRFVRDSVLRRAISAAYKGLLPQGRHPVVVLDIQVAPDRVDVNVHPAKTEVRFRDPWAVVEAVSEGLRKTLDGRPVQARATNEDSAFVQRTSRETGPGPLFMPAATVVSTSRPVAENKPLAEVVATSTSERLFSPPETPIPARTPPKSAPIPAHPDDDPRFQSAPSWLAAEPTAELGPSWRTFRAFGVVGHHLHGELGGQWVVLHTGLANGRLLDFDARKHAVRPQRLLVPLVVSLTAEQASSLQKGKDLLISHGLDMEIRRSTAVVLAVPEGIELSPAAVVEMANALEKGGSVGAALTSCFPSVGEEQLEWRTLLARLEEANVPLDGLVARWSAAEIDRRIRKS